MNKKDAKDQTPQEQGDFAFRGRHFHKVGTPIFDERGEVARIVFVYTDITAQKASEQALREAEVRLNTILNTVQSGILLIDPQTHTIAPYTRTCARAWRCTS